MSRVFFTSDLHLGHENLCRHIRGMSAEDNANLIVENWNKTVAKRDIVYICGDIVMEKTFFIDKYIPLLKGTVYVIPGNHDTIKVCKRLTQLGVCVIGNISYKGFFLSHIPVIESELKSKRGNIHGHIHSLINEESGSKMLYGKYFNVNCEFHNYTPILFEEIERQMKLRETL